MTTNPETTKCQNCQGRGTLAFGGMCSTCGGTGRESQTTIPHTDDVAVDRFAWRMKLKLADAREKGRGGWEQCHEPVLMAMLREHVEKGDMLDIANLAMMIWHNRESYYRECEQTEQDAKAAT